MTTTCVIRPVAGSQQYIPVADAVHLNIGEQAFTGEFATDTQKDGPSGSHLRTICLPLGKLAVEKLTAERISSFGK